MANYSIWLSENSTCYEYSCDAVFSGYWKNGQKMILPQSIVIVKGEGKNILIDTGMDPNDEVNVSVCEKYSFINLRSPEYMLKKVGLKPEDIDAVILTHAHFDHMGAIPCYPNAHFYIQKKELESWLTLCSLPKQFSNLYAVTPVKFIAQLIEKMGDHRVTLLDGDVDNLFPGIHIRTAFNSHTAGSQYALIENDGKMYAAIGDIAYVKENLFGIEDNGFFVPNGFATGDPVSVMKAMNEIRKYTDDDYNRIIAIHDLRVWTKYPTVKDDEGLSFAEVCLAPGEKSRF